MVSNTTATDRVREHAKLLRYAGRQALVFLARNDDNDLTIVVQLWVARQDTQLRVSIRVDGADDHVIGNAFDDLNDESLALALDALGAPEIIAEEEAEETEE